MSSIQKRFLFSAGANIVRAAISLSVGLLVARGLGPADYGNLAYLLGSFWAIRVLLDMGSSSAFFTFISQSKRSTKYYAVYFIWLSIQFLISVSLIALLLPASTVDLFWIGQHRELILLALLATFFQNQVWQTIVQIYEAERNTIQIQIAGLTIIFVHLILVINMLAQHWLSVQSILYAIIAEYAIAAVWLSITIRNSLMNFNTSIKQNPSCQHESLGKVMKAYVNYCRPMIIMAIFSFLYEMADRWLLQRYGGPTQQGFYQVAAQLSTISLLAATSILNIFWKEIAEANASGEHQTVAKLYLKTTQSLVFVAAAVSCFLAPWAEPLVDTLLGSAYYSAWPILLILLFYPIHQAVGQINGTLFMATNWNTVYMKITVVGQLVSIPISYLMIAPVNDSFFSGFELGGFGLALKTLAMSFLFVNMQSWVISRQYHIAFQWRRQIAVIVILLGLGYACRILIEILFELMEPALNLEPQQEIILRMTVSGIVYLVGLFMLWYRMPRLAGMESKEVEALFGRIRAFFSCSC